MDIVCALSLYICLYLCSSFFRILDVDSNTNNEDRICHGTDDLESASQYESDISDGCDLQPQPNTGLFVVVGWLEFVVVGFVDVGELALMAAELMVFVAAVYMLFQE